MRLEKHNDAFPKDLIAEVIALRVEVTPRFLGMLEDIDQNPEPSTGVVFSIYSAPVSVLR